MSDDWDELDYDDGWGFDNSTRYPLKIILFLSPKKVELIFKLRAELLVLIGGKGCLHRDLHHCYNHHQHMGGYKSIQGMTTKLQKFLSCQITFSN